MIHDQHTPQSQKLDSLVQSASWKCAISKVGLRQLRSGSIVLTGKEHCYSVHMISQSFACGRVI